MRGWIQRHAAGLVVLLLAVTLAAPGADIQVWDGLPFDSLPELLALVLLVPLVFSRALRGRLVELGRRLHPKALRLTAVALGVILGLKLILLVAGFEDGFRACYSSPAASPPAAGCERSYSNLFDRHGGATRLDHEIAFGVAGGGPAPALSPSNWRLQFVDDLRFNPPSKPSNPNPRDRLPLTVRWTGETETSAGTKLVIRYVGEGVVRIGDRSVTLPQSYLGEGEVRLPAPGGRHTFSLAYSYRPLITIGPYATIDVSTTHAPDGAAGGSALHVASAPIPWRVVAIVGDAALALLLLLIAVGQVRAIGRRDSALLLGVLAVGWLVLVDYSPWREALFVAALGAVLVLVRPNRALIVAWYALVFVCSLHPLLAASSLGDVAYKSSGTDWLAFESQARSLLGGSLRGGESIFFYQPGWRYVLFLEHALLGDGDVLRSAFAFVTVSLPVLAVGFMALATRAGRKIAVPVAALVGAALLVVNSPDVRLLLSAGVSEGVTWALIPAVVAIPIFAPRQRWPWVVGPVALAVTLAISANQLLGALVLMVAMGFAARPEQRRWFVAGTALAVVVTLLPALHDTIYGDRFLGVSLTSGTTAGAQIPTQDLVRLWDGAVRSKLWTHIQQLLYITGPPGEYSAFLAFVLPALLLSWVAVLVHAVRRRGSTPRGRLIATAAPAAYLLPYLVYQVDDHFPRHLVAGYLAMSAVTIGMLATEGSLGRMFVPGYTRWRIAGLAPTLARWSDSRPPPSPSSRS